MRRGSARVKRFKVHDEGKVMPKSNKTSKKWNEYDPREADRMAYLLSIATAPHVHDTIAPSLLGAPDYPVRYYGTVDQVDPARVDVLWEAPKESLATLKYPLKNTSSVRGTGVNDQDNRLVDYWSTIERDLADMLKVDHRVASFWEQPEEQEYVDQDGVIHGHTFDFLVTLKTGEKIAIAVKDEEHRLSSGIEEVVAAFRAQRPDKNFADHYVVRTRDQVTYDLGHNSRLIIWARRLRDASDIEQLIEVMTPVPGQIVLSKVLDAIQNHDGGFVAAVNLIDTGHIINVDGSRIDHDILVRFEPAGRQVTS